METFYSAVQNGKTGIIKLMLDRGIKIDQIPNNPLALSKSLFMMIMNNHLETFRFLVDKGIIDINMPIQLDMNKVMYGTAYVFYGPMTKMMDKLNPEKQISSISELKTKQKNTEKKIISFYALQLAAFWRHLDFFEYCLPSALPKQLSFLNHMVLMNEKESQSGDLVKILNALEQHGKKFSEKAIVPFNDFQHPVVLAISSKQNEHVLSHLINSEYYSDFLIDANAGSILYQLLVSNYSYNIISSILKLNGEILFHYAARTDDAKSIKHLIKSGYKIKEQINAHGETALHIAILYKSKQAINALVGSDSKKKIAIFGCDTRWKSWPYIS